MQANCVCTCACITYRLPSCARIYTCAHEALLLRINPNFLDYVKIITRISDSSSVSPTAIRLILAASSDNLTRLDVEFNVFPRIILVLGIFCSVLDTARRLGISLGVQSRLHENQGRKQGYQDLRVFMHDGKVWPNRWQVQIGKHQPGKRRLFSRSRTDQSCLH